MISIDQLNRKISLPKLPERIVSVVPSQTELLYDLGLGEKVIGITKFCIHPNEWFVSRTRVGGTKNLNIEKILSLRPDIIFANKEENNQEQIEELAGKVPLWISEISTLEEALSMILEVSRITGTEEKGNAIAGNIRMEFERLHNHRRKIRAAYIIWKNPYMTAGGDTFISEMLYRAGFENVFGELQRYPEITMQQLSDSNADVILLSSEPFPFKEVHVAELAGELPGKKVMTVDGEMFSWYGSHLLRAPSYFIELRDKVDSAL